MHLEDLGLNSKLQQLWVDQNPDNLEIGRIIAEYKERYLVKTSEGEFEAEITGNMRFTAGRREDFPAVGDWVALVIYDHDFAVIHKILPRFSVLKRRAVGVSGDIQLIATNIDFAFLVQAADRDFNINRLERFLTICYSGKVVPIIVLTKTDLTDNQRISELFDSIKDRIKNVPVLAISNETLDGMEALSNLIEKGKTYCMLGSSGVGKSTLLNNLSGRDIMKTSEISQSSQRGRHVTSHRELTVLTNGGIIIDNPGMREVGIADVSGGLEATFNSIISLSGNCRFKDCTHTHEVGCSILAALDSGELDPASYDNYLKMEKEKSHFETTVAEKRKKEKIFGKIIKNYLDKDIKQRKP
ncbi:MAG: ribosome small subunit-dependent GTPase A [Bacteroidales bacterium]|nr:ribosome small subunit-dependent GTPase A [Bacteroidales bacterium]